MESKHNESVPDSDSKAELAALETIVAEQRTAQGISDPEVARVKFQMATLPPLTAAQEEKLNAEREAIDHSERMQAQAATGCLPGKRWQVTCWFRLSNFDATHDRQRKVLAAAKEYGETMQERIDNREGLILFGQLEPAKIIWLSLWAASQLNATTYIASWSTFKTGSAMFVMAWIPTVPSKRFCVNWFGQMF